MMLRPIALTVGVLLAATVALAATIDIPGAYAGSFPRVDLAYYSLTNIKGRFTGKRLTFTAKLNRRGKSSPASGSYGCSQLSSTETRCAGTFKAEGKAGKSSEVVIGWKGGRPISMAFSKN